MAGDWIKFEVATSDKPEVWQIAQELGIDPDAVVGKLLRVWAWFDQHTEDGNAPSVTKNVLDRSVGVTGFCNAVVSVGWLGEEDGVLSITNFTHHNGETAKKRAQTAKRAASHRKRNKGVTPGNAESDDESNATSVTKSVPKEEKIKDKDINNKNSSAGAKEKQKRRRRLSANFSLSDSASQYAKSFWLTKGRGDLLLDEQFAQFCDYHRAKGSLMVDWDSAWKTWVRNAVEFTKPPGGPKPAGSQDDFIDKHTDRNWAEGL
jgi:hypothetical protein